MLFNLKATLFESIKWYTHLRYRAAQVINNQKKLAVTRNRLKLFVDFFLFLLKKYDDFRCAQHYFRLQMKCIHVEGTIY